MVQLSGRALPWKPLPPVMVNFKERSYQPELLDAEDIPFEDIRQNMGELNTVNRFLGGHHITRAGVKKLSGKINNEKVLSICEIGCGGGDNLLAIQKWCKQNNIRATFTGIDIKQECILFAQQQNPALNATWIHSDYAKVDLTTNKPDIIFSSLFCHHFTEPELEKMLTWMKQNCNKGFFINDLQRHPFAYYSIRLLTGFFSKSYLVKNDAPLSVARGFKRKEWEAIFSAAGIHSYDIQWKWAFRYLIVCKNEN